MSLAPTPARGSFPVASPAIAESVEPASIAATWIGHSTVLLQLEGLNVLTDPMFSERASPVSWAGPRRVMDPGVPIESLPRIDVVLQSHNHYDHLDARSVRTLARLHPRCTWFAPLGVGAYLQRFGATHIVELDWWQSANLDALRVTATPARHFSARTAGDRNRSLWSGFAIEYRGARAWFAGDTAYHPEFTTIGERQGPFDLVMIPIGAYDPRWFMHVVHADPEEAVQIYKDVVAAHPGSDPPTMLGVHWGTFRLTDEPLDEPPRRTAARWREAGLDGRLLWIAQFGETRSWSRIDRGASARRE